MCVCVSVCVCMCMCMFICIGGHSCADGRVSFLAQRGGYYRYAYMYVYVFTHVHSYKYICQNLNISRYERTLRMFVRRYTCVYILCVYMYV